jgi:Adenylate and Guanylate cyclase catalytic domain
MIKHTSLIYANFFFTDIVGLSDPRMSTKTQIRKIEALNKLIKECIAFKATPKDSLIVLPTGDGMAIGFFQSPELPLNLAIELHRKIGIYNRAKIPTEALRIRIGIHSGPVFIVNDVLENKNVWGPGIIIARRIMDLGNDGHILLSSRIAEDLRELSDEYKKIIKPWGCCLIRYNIRCHLYF